MINISDKNQLLFSLRPDRVGGFRDCHVCRCGRWLHDDRRHAAQLHSSDNDPRQLQVPSQLLDDPSTFLNIASLESALISWMHQIYCDNMIQKVFVQLTSLLDLLI